MPTPTPTADPSAPFGCTYAGVPLTLATRELAEWVAANAPPPEVPVVTRLGWPASRLAGLTGIGAPQRQSVRVGCLWWPTGASRHAVGHFLCTGNQLKAIYGGPTLTTGGAPPPYARTRELKMKTAQGEITTNLWPLPPRPLSAMTVQQPPIRDLYLLTLVDARFWWWYTATGDINLTDDTTSWSSLYGQVTAGIDGISWSADAVDADLLNAPKNLRIQYEPIPPVLDAVAYNVGQRIVRKLDGGVVGRGNVASQASLQNNLQKEGPQAGGWKLVAGGNYNVGFTAGVGRTPDPNYDTVLALPEKLSVAFRDYDGGGNPLSTFTNESVALTTADPNLITVPGGVKAFRCERSISVGTRTAFVTAFAKAWGRQQLAPVARRYAGIVPWEIEGLSDAVEWCYRLDECHTTVHRPAFEDGVSELLGPAPPANPAGLSVTKTIVVAFDPTTCAVTTNDFTWTNGVLTAVV